MLQINCHQESQIKRRSSLDKGLDYGGLTAATLTIATIKIYQNMYLIYFTSKIVLRARLVPEKCQEHYLRGTRNPEPAPSALFVHCIDTTRLN